MAPDELRAVFSPLLSREEPSIWITENSYVCFGGVDRTIDPQHKNQFELELTNDTGERYKYCLSIHASTLEEAIICLDYLVGLQDTHF
jgi:hypothetical protein